MKRLNITNLLYCSILIIVGSNVMVSDLSGEGFPYLGKNDVFLLGIITGYYIGYAYNSKYFNFDIIDKAGDLDNFNDFQTFITFIIVGLLNLASKCILFLSFFFILVPSIMHFILIHFFSWWVP